MEIEAKLDVPDEGIWERLRRARKLERFTLQPGGTIVLDDTYLDTPSRLVQAAGFVCRLRRSGRKMGYTLKSLGGGEGEIYRREEAGIDLEAEAPPEKWPAGPARDRILGITGGEPLLPVVKIRQRRTTRLVMAGRRHVAELCLDLVSVPDGSAAHHFREVEIELVPGGDEDDLLEMVAVLKGRWGLLPVSGSKYERATALAGPRNPQSKRIGIKPGHTMAEAARLALAFHFRRMLSHEKGTRLGEDPEELHDMRVATRRMRAAIRVFRKHIDPEAIRPHMKGLRRTGGALGAVRDLDVFYDKTLIYLKGLAPDRRGGLEPLLEALRDAHNRARSGLVAYLDSDEYRMFCGRFSEFLATPGAGEVQSGGRGGEPIAHEVRHIVPAVLYRRYAGVLIFDGLLSVRDAPPARYHQLRIAAKGLRYTLEFFEEVLTGDAGTLIKDLKALQDHLGNMQDAFVAGSMLGDFLSRGRWGEETGDGGSPPQQVAAPGVEEYLAYRQAEHKLLRESFPDAWERVRGESFRDRLGSVAAALIKA